MRKKHNWRKWIIASLGAGIIILTGSYFAIEWGVNYFLGSMVEMPKNIEIEQLKSAGSIIHNQETDAPKVRHIKDLDQETSAVKPDNLLNQEKSNVTDHNNDPNEAETKSEPNHNEKPDETKNTLDQAEQLELNPKTSEPDRNQSIPEQAVKPEYENAPVQSEEPDTKEPLQPVEINSLIPSSSSAPESEATLDKESASTSTEKVEKSDQGDFGYSAQISEEKAEKVNESITFVEKAKIMAVLVKRLKTEDIEVMMNLVKDGLTIPEKRQAKDIILDRLEAEEYNELISIAEKYGLSQGKTYEESLKD